MEIENEIENVEDKEFEESFSNLELDNIEPINIDSLKNIEEINIDDYILKGKQS